MLSWCPQQNWQELLSNLPTTLKDYHKPDTNKNFKQQKHKQRLQFNNNNENLYQLQKNLHKYKQPIDILQKSKIERQVAYEIGETNCEEEQQQWRIQDADDAWIWTPLPDRLFDNIDIDGIVYYTMGPNKYNKKWWYNFQKDYDHYYYKKLQEELETS